MKEAKQRITSAIDRARSDLEEALYQLEKLTPVSDDSADFAAHALSNYITVTGGTVDLLRIYLDDDPRPEVHKLLDALHRSTELMTHTVGQMRSASVGSDTEPSLSPVDLSLMAQRFRDFYQPIADRKRIRCILEPSEEVVIAWTDRIMCAVVMDNLVSNAVKFSEPGSRIWIHLAVAGDEVACSVGDEGPGLGPEDQARLFQRGVRLTPRPTAGEPSTGYGLAVTKEFLDRMGGAVACESELGKGATFSFRLPRYREALHGAEGQSARASS